MKQSLETCVATTGLALHFMGLFSAQAQPPSTNTTYAVVDRAADTKTVQSVTTITQPNGYAVRKTNSYVELAPGMHYLENGQWKESRALIEILPGGTGAIAKYGRHKVTFAPDINTDGSIDLTTADGKHLRSHILGLGYYDTASGDVQFIAVVQNSDGLLSGTNQVIYTNAFEGLLADVRYPYRRAGLEQDVILREQPQSPTNFNMNAETTRLVVFTEFLNPPIPIKTTNAIPGTDLVDERLDFGKTKMIRGRAFPLQNVGGQRASVPTAKSWITVDGRTFLIEEVKYRAVEEQLRALPDQSGLLNSKESKNSRIATIGRASSRILAAKKIAGLRDKYLAQHQSRSTMTVASIDLRKAGYVLDYETMDSTATDFTFQPNTTYYIVAEGSGGVVLYGNTTIGDGAVIKSQFDGMYQGVDQYVLYQASGTLTCPTDLQNPAIFTDWCDDSVGAVISGSSGYPNANYPWVLTLENYVTPQLNNLIFKQGMPAVFAYGGVGPIRNCQFVGNTASGVTAQWGNVYLGNVLFAGYCDTALSVLDYGQEVTAENVTAQLYYGNFCPNSDYITYRNCLLAGGTFPGSYSTDTAFGASFESGPMGDFYLPSGSPHRDAGTATIDSQLATDLQSLTTYAPPVYTADTDTPDRGFHYPIVTDSDHDGLPDAWELAHFGALNRDGTGDYDGDGYSDANEFNAGSDPNTIRFYTVFNNLRVNGNTAWGTNTAYKGVPVKMKVLVDNSNLEDGSWTTYSASFSASIGSVEGSHDVWVGLKGSAEDSKPTWARINLIRDTTAPLVVVTNPTASVVFQSLLQLQGYVTEPVQSISFDVANTNGVTTNLSGYVTHQTFNTNTHTLATNWFDCTDIELAEGTNRFTLRVVDRAGNIKTNTVDCTYLLPTNAPVVGVVWPGNGANLSGNAFTIRGTINDVTATVTAEVTTASTRNTATAIIESNGQFWIENLPLGSGNNSIKLTAVDVASNTTVTSFDVVKSSVAVTIDPLSESVLNKPFVNVTGTINVNNHKVWVNGVEATLDNTTWTAQNVPLNSGGTAIVQARAIPTTDNNGNGNGGGGSVGFDSSANPSSASSTTTEAEQDKPPEMVVWYYDESTVLEVTEVYPLPGVGHSLQIYDTHWELGESGHWMADHCFRYLVDEDYFNWTTEWWNKEGLGEQSTGGDVGPGVCGIKDPWTTGTFQVGTSWPLEFCDVSVQGGRETEYADYIASVNSRKAETRIWFHTGGKASVKKKSLFAFSGGASGVGNWFWPDFDDYFPFLVGIPEYKQPFPIPNTAVKLGSLGQLDASG